MHPTIAPTDDQIRALPAFARLKRIRRTDQLTSAFVTASWLTIGVLAFRGTIHNLFIPWIPVCVVGAAVQLYDRRAETKALNEISTDPDMRRRVMLLYKPWAEHRFLRLLP